MVEKRAFQEADLSQVGGGGVGFGWHRVEPLCWSFPSNTWLGNFLILSSSVKLGLLEGGDPCLICYLLLPYLYFFFILTVFIESCRQDR